MLPDICGEYLFSYLLRDFWNRDKEWKLHLFWHSCFLQRRNLEWISEFLFYKTSSISVSWFLVLVSHAGFKLKKAVCLMFFWTKLVVFWGRVC